MNITSPQYEEQAPYWKGVSASTLLIKHCAACDQAHFYPRVACPHCLAATTTWVESGGKGEIYSYSTSTRNGQEHTIAYVLLDEGVKLMTGIVPLEGQKPFIGQRVGAVYVDDEVFGKIPMFTPLARD